MVSARRILIGFFLFLVLIFGFQDKAKASLESCTASVSPSTVSPGITQSFSFTVNNTGSSSVTFIQIATPSDNFTILDSSAGDWSRSTADHLLTLNGASVSPGSSFSFSISISVSRTEAAEASWTISASDSGDGSGKIGCSGSLGTAIAGTAPDITSPEILSASVTDIYSTEAKVVWTTDEASDSTVNYGTTSESYPSSKSDGGLVTSHSLTLTGLSANTTYYFIISSKDAAGNTVTLEEASFTTAAADAGVATTVTVNTTTTVVITPTPTPKPLVDTAAPVVSITTDFAAPYKEAPTIAGKATDAGAINAGVAKVEYSTDGGTNWLPVDVIDNEGGRSTTFDFTPAIFEDGNYKIKVRAKDATGNTGSSSVKTLVIDRLPPRVGGILYSAGSLVLTPGLDGIYSVLTGMKLRLTFPAVGGPTEIKIVNGEKTSLANKNVDNGLWSTEMVFETAGSHTLTAEAVDGADNRTKRDLGTIEALSPGRVSMAAGSLPEDVRLTVYTLEPDTNQFVVWDGSSFGLENPQTLKGGGYSLYLPAGKYYFVIAGSGYRPLVTGIFELASARAITNDLVLEQKRYGWFDFWQTEVDLNLREGEAPTGSDPVVGKEFPAIGIGFKGKPAVISLLGSWLPQIGEQMAALEELALAQKGGLNVIAVTSEETVSKTAIFAKIGGYTLPIAADPDGELIEALSVGSIPTNYFLDRLGIIRGVKLGRLTGAEMEKYLSD